MDEVQFDDLGVLLNSPLPLANVWVQVVVPALTALLANASRQAFGNLSPVFGAL